MSDVTAQAFREAAAEIKRWSTGPDDHYNDFYVTWSGYMLAAAEQREQWDAAIVRTHGPLTSPWVCRACQAVSVCGPDHIQHYANCSMMTGAIKQDALTAAEQREQLDALKDECAMLRRAYETVQDNEFAALSPSTHAQNLAQQVRTLTAELELQRKFTTSAEQSFLVMKAERDEALAKLIQVHAWMTSDDGLDRLIAIMKDTAAWRTEP